MSFVLNDLRTTTGRDWFGSYAIISIAIHSFGREPKSLVLKPGHPPVFLRFTYFVSTFLAGLKDVALALACAWYPS